MAVEFEGQRFIGINGGPEFKFDEAVSFEIECETRAEIDPDKDRGRTRDRGDAEDAQAGRRGAAGRCPDRSDG
jgi:predicted 3-demethylubiquinone-9 3-methyltransferase (glyoxalase superfamily)